MDWTDHSAPDLVAFEALAEAALKALPDEVRQIARSVALRIEDFADDATLADLGIDDPSSSPGFMTEFR